MHNPFSPREANEPTGAQDVPRGRTLCELNGLLIGTEHSNSNILLPVASWLPVSGLSEGFGIDVPPSAPGAANGGQIGPKDPGVTAANTSLAARLRTALGVPPPPSVDAHTAPTDARLVAFAWQPHALLTPPTLVAGSCAPHLLGAAALPDDSIAIYNLHEQRWSSHRLANTQQKRLASLAWQPQSLSILAAACAKGVCIWRLAYSSEGQLAGAHLLRVIEPPADLDGLPSPPHLLAWHPLGRWLAAGSPATR
jgi:hypothetical protein